MVHRRCKNKKFDDISISTMRHENNSLELIKTTN